MAEFLETPRFPPCPSFGYTATYLYDVTKIITAGGQEDRNAPTEQPLVQLDVTVGPREEDEILEILEWVNAMGGEFVGFRVKNYADFKSCRINQVAAATDCPLQPMGSSPESYQLVKRYLAGTKHRDLDILKPVAGTIRVANELGDEQAADRWDLDETAGVLIPLGGFVGVPTTWGGEFDLPMRFEGRVPIEIINYKIQSTSFTLVQLREP